MKETWGVLAFEFFPFSPLLQCLSKILQLLLAPICCISPSKWVRTKCLYSDFDFRIEIFLFSTLPWSAIAIQWKPPQTMFCKGVHESFLIRHPSVYFCGQRHLETAHGLVVDRVYSRTILVVSHFDDSIKLLTGQRDIWLWHWMIFQFSVNSVSVFQAWGPEKHERTSC